MADQLFNDDNPVTPQATPEQTTPVSTPNTLFADQLASIKNDSGEQKYDTPEKALEALQHSQQYIPELKAQAATQAQEISDLKAKLEATRTVEEIISQQTPPTSNEPTSPALGQEDVQRMVTEALTQRSAADTQSANSSQVSKALTEKFGDNAQAEITKIAASLNMKPSELGALAKSNPSMVLALFGETTGSVSTTTNSYNLSPTTTVEELKAPDKSMLRGATSKDITSFMQQIQADVYRKNGITQ